MRLSNTDKNANNFPMLVLPVYHFSSSVSSPFHPISNVTNGDELIRSLEHAGRYSGGEAARNDV